MSDLLRAAEAVLDLLGDEDLPDNGELSGAAITDALRAAVEAEGATEPSEVRALRMVALLDSGESYHVLYGEPMPSEDFGEFVAALALRGYWPRHVKSIVVCPER